jgi:transposase InsO family protein
VIGLIHNLSGYTRVLPAAHHFSGRQLRSSIVFRHGSFSAAGATVTGINQLWAADIPYVRLKGEFVYLAVILDRFSRKVVGWAVDRTMMSSRLTVAALERAVADPQPQVRTCCHINPQMQPRCRKAFRMVSD